MPIPEFTQTGDLPEGVHRATLSDVLARFGNGSPQRRDVTVRLQRIHLLIFATGKIDRFIIYGSYITAKPEPDDVDIFLVMSEKFDVNDYVGETRALFSHITAHDRFGASIFWVNQGTSFTNIEDLIAGWQTKRDLTRRGIIEITEEVE